MTIPTDDPRLTAYALGELEDPARAEIEERLAADPALREELEALRALAGSLETSFAAEGHAGLAPSARQAVLEAAATPAPSPMRPWMLRAAVVLGVAVSVGLGALWMPGEGEEGTARHAPELAARTSAGARNRRPASRTAGYGAVGPAETDLDGGAPVASYEGAEAKPPGAIPPGLRDPTDPVPPAGPPPSPATVLVPKPQTDADQPFVGPVSNGTIGLAGGSGGALAGRGGKVGRRLVRGASRWARGVYGLPGAGTPGGSVTGPGTEAYDRPGDNPFLETAKAHTSTFSLDVDTASYANVRRFLMHQGVLPPTGAVRIEELLNYFAYGYAPPAKDAKHPFRTHVAVTSCPWAPRHLLARIAIKGRVVDAAERPAANLVFLVDVSGSMRPQNKLPLVKQGLRLLVERLGARDKVAIVTYAGQAGVALPSTSCAEKDAILAAIDRLSANGSTNGEAGIQIAYRLARENFVEGGVNRVLLATDGDFNVGQTSRDALVALIRRSAKRGTFLSILGYGMGNYKDGRMEALSNQGNGTYAYIDSLAETKKVLVEGLTGELVPIAKDVKVQLFFNPRTVSAYRLIGYENRRLAARDFNDDRKDAGDVGAGHTVTAFYELVPTGVAMPGRAVDPNPFVKPAPPKPAAEPAVEHPTALFQLRLRYKQPAGETSTLLEQMVEPSEAAFDAADDDFRFASAVAAFGMKLRRSPYAGRIAWDAILEIGEGALGEDPQGRRSEFLQLVKKAKELMGG